MKIAIPTEDKNLISEHFGGAPYFMVITTKNNYITNKEVINKPGHKKFASIELAPQIDEKGRHGMGLTATERHKKIREVIKDCDVIIAGRMGFGAYKDFQNFGMKVIITDIKPIDLAVLLYLENKLINLEDRIC